MSLIKLKRPKNLLEVRIHWMLLTALNCSWGFRDPRQVWNSGLLRQSVCSSLCLLWSISQCGGGYFIVQSGQIFLVSLAFSSLLQCQMAKFSTPFPRLTWSNAALGNDTIHNLPVLNSDKVPGNFHLKLLSTSDQRFPWYVLAIVATFSKKL